MTADAGAGNPGRSGTQTLVRGQASARPGQRRTCTQAQTVFTARYSQPLMWTLFLSLALVLHVTREVLELPRSGMNIPESC